MPLSRHLLNSLVLNELRGVHSSKSPMSAMSLHPFNPFSPFPIGASPRSFIDQAVAVRKRATRAKASACAIVHASCDAPSSGIATDSRAAQTYSDAQLADQTDEQLLTQHLAGNAGAFSEIVARYRDPLLHFLIRFLGSRAAAEDVFQDAFLQVHISAERFDTSRRFKPWLYTIAANKARDFHRRQKRRSALSLSAPISGEAGESEFIDLLASDHERPDVPLTEHEEAGIVKSVVDDLPTHYREILLLSYFQKMSYNQISEALKIPLGTVKSRLHSAVASFADTYRAQRTAANDTGIPKRIKDK